MHLQLAPVRVGELAERLLIAGPGALQRGLLHPSSMPFPAGAFRLLPPWCLPRQHRFSSTKGISMTETTSPALRTALAYYQAWTNHDLDQAMSYIADDIVCDAPAGRLEGAAAYRGFMGPFVQILRGSKLIAAFGDDRTALIMYDTETVPVPSAPGAPSASPSSTARSHTAGSSSTGAPSTRRGRPRARPGGPRRRC